MLLYEHMKEAAPGDAAALREGLLSPLDLDAVLARLELPLVRRVGGGSKREARLVRVDHGYEIRLYSDPDRSPFDARERFTVAHEIAHYWVERRFGYRPRNDHAYWRLERVCNLFAGHLLVASEDLNELRRNPPLTSSELFLRTDALADELRISFAAAAHRVCDVVEKACFFALRKPVDGSSERAKLAWRVGGTLGLASADEDRIETEALSARSNRGRAAGLAEVPVREFRAAIRASGRYVSAAVSLRRHSVPRPFHPPSKSAAGRSLYRQEALPLGW